MTQETNSPPNNGEEQATQATFPEAYYVNTISKHIRSLIFTEWAFTKALCNTALAITDAPGITAGTDGKKIVFGTEFLSKCSSEQIKGLIMHEILHVALGHPLMLVSKVTDKRAFNIACDEHINAELLNAGYSLPANGVPAYFGEKSIWQRYLYLKELNQKQRGKQQQQGTTGTANQGREAQEQQDQQDRKQQKEQNKNEDNRQSETLNEKKDKEALQQDFGWSEMQEPTDANNKPLTKEQAQEQLNELQKEMDDQAARGNPAGKRPGRGTSVSDLVVKVPEPIGNWARLIAMQAHYQPDDSFDYRRQDRRYQDSEFIMPSMSGNKPVRTILVCDTSGSMARILDRACRELLQATIEFQKRGEGSSLKIIWADCEVCGEQTIEYGDSIDPKGGGGTSFRPAVEYIVDNYPETQHVFYITDGYGFEFAEDPGIPTTWVIIGEDKNINEEFKPPYGEVIFAEK